MQTTLMVIGTLTSLFIIGLLIWLILETKKKNTGGQDEKSFNLLLQQLNEVNRNVDEKISSVNEQVSKHLLNVTREVSETKESNKQIFDLAKGLQDLEKVLKNQKTRGNLGEMGLELILSNILPPDQYKMQYLFSDNSQVDAIIKTQEGIIPVDAKFSLDNYRRVMDETDTVRRVELEKEFKKDLKKRIDETAKYIKPNEGTLPFAFMFIPAEGIYYDLLVNEVGAIKANTRNLIDYAYNDKKVIIVSPTTFSAYLQSVLYGFKAFKIEKDAQEIRKNVGLLGKHLNAYQEFMLKLGKSISVSVNHYNASSKELGKIDKDVTKITGESPTLEIENIDRPSLE